MRPYLRFVAGLFLFLVPDSWAQETKAPAEVTKPDLRPQLVVGTEVFHDLVGSPLVEAKLEWRFAILENDSVNAYSDSKGHVWVAGGLAQLLNDDRGLWAAVLSHEIAHVILRHPNLALKGLHLALPYVFGKVLRDREHRADATGMMLMVQAGYHPDSVFALQHLLRRVRGDTPKPLAFLSTHPRWDTREEHSRRVYDEALAEFARRWPDVAASPGGPPPLLVFLGEPTVSATAAPSAFELRVPLYCRNSPNPVSVVLKPDHDTDMQKELRREAQCPEAEGGVVSVALDGAQAASRRSFRAKVGVYGADGRLRALSQSFEIRLAPR